MATIKDVAKKAGVAPSTVSLVLNNKPWVSEKTRKKVMKAIRELNYHPNSTARGLATSRTGNIGFVLDDFFCSIAEPFYSRMLLGAEFESRNHNFFLLLSSIESRFRKGMQMPRMFAEKKVDGVILAGKMSKAFLTTIMEEKLPYILLDYYLEENAPNYVGIDNYNGALEAIRYLIKLGHRKIGFVGAYNAHPSFKERLKAYKDALEEANIPYHPEYVMNKPKDVPENDAYSITKAHLQHAPIPTAIFTGNDFTAIGVIKALRELGLKIPHDVSIMGFDDSEYAMHTEPRLTTISVPKEEMGAIAVKELIDLIEGRVPEHKPSRVKTTLIVRDTTGICK